MQEGVFHGYAGIEGQEKHRGVWGVGSEEVSCGGA